MKNFVLLLSLLLIFTACKSENTCTDCEKEQDKDSVDMKDTVPSLENALKNNGPITDTQEKKENLAKIVKKYGEQWDFCTCVQSNDSINKAFEKTLTSKQEEKLMARWEYVEVKCKEFLTQPNTTPEERAIHEKKVKKCLRSKK